MYGMPTTSLMRRNALLMALCLAAACRDFEPDPILPPPPPPPPPSGSAMPFRVGSLGADYAKGVATDVVGNGYVTGYFNGSVDFDPSAAATIRPSLGGNDISVAKYAPNGSLVWIATLGGPSNEQPMDIITTADGGAIITGFSSPGITCNGAPVTGNGGRDILVAKVSATGSCQWAFNAGGPLDDEGRNLVLRSDGSIAVVGLFRGTADFDPSTGVAPLSSRGGVDGFVATYTSTGVFIKVAQIGGLDDDAALAVAAHAGGDVVVGGEFRGIATLGLATGAIPLVSTGESDFFVARFDAQLDLAWANRGGGPQLDYVNSNGIVVEPGGSVVVVGNFSGVANVGTGGAAVPLASVGSQDVFIARYDQNGSWQGLAQRFGGLGTDGAQGVAIDPSGNILIAGWFQGVVDFDPGPGTRLVTGLGTNGAGDAYVMSLDPAANLRWVAPIGAVVAGDANFALGASVAADATGSVWAVGRLFGVVDLDPGAGAVTVQSGGDADHFIVRYNASTGALER